MEKIDNDYTDSDMNNRGYLENKLDYSQPKIVSGYSLSTQSTCG